MKCYLCDEEIDINNSLSYDFLPQSLVVHRACQQEAEADGRMEHETN